MSSLFQCSPRKLSERPSSVFVRVGMHYGCQKRAACCRRARAVSRSRRGGPGQRRVACQRAPETGQLRPAADGIRRTGGWHPRQLGRAAAAARQQRPLREQGTTRHGHGGHTRAAETGRSCDLQARAEDGVSSFHIGAALSFCRHRAGNRALKFGALVSLSPGTGRNDKSGLKS